MPRILARETAYYGLQHYLHSNALSTSTQEQRTVDLLGRVHTQWRDMVPMGSAAEDAGYAVSAE
jgi:hypothetical protein